MRVPDTGYTSSGGISIAYQVHGAEQPDLLFAGTTASNIETIWHLPEAARFFERLGAFARVIRFDRRDTGISDPTKEDLTLEAHAEDALAVMDAVGSERPFLLGGIEACRSLAVLAATHPDRVAGLVAICPSAQGSAVSAPEVADEVAAAVADMTWPDSVLDVWAPSLTRDPERRRRVASYIRTAATPVQVERLLRLSLTSNVADVLPLVQTPTLVLRPVDSHMPEAPQREFADLVKGSIYEEIPGDAVFIYGLDVDRLAGRIEAFVTGTTPQPVTDRVLATILFTDLVRSTERAAELGDREWTALLARHLTAARDATLEPWRRDRQVARRRGPGDVHGARACRALRFRIDRRDAGDGPGAPSRRPRRRGRSQRRRCRRRSRAHRRTDHGAGGRRRDPRFEDGAGSRGRQRAAVQRSRRPRSGGDSGTVERVLGQPSVDD